MERRSWRLLLAIVIGLTFSCSHVLGESPSSKPPPSTAPSVAAAAPDDPDAAVDPRALASLNRMTAALAGATALSVTIDSGYDAVQPSGLKVEFGETRTVTLRRPDRIRIDNATRDGNQRGFRFDGKTIAVFDTDQKVYAVAEKPGTSDEALKYLVDSLQMPMPLSELFTSNLPKFTRNLEALDWVEAATIAGVPTDHLVGSTRSIDFQVWVAQREPALPQRLIITYKREDGEPQRWAQFRDWDLSPRTPDTLFAYTPPEGAERIPFAPRKRVAAAAGSTSKGGTR
jgi:hypothetical protein